MLYSADTFLDHGNRPNIGALLPLSHSLRYGGSAGSLRLSSPRPFLMKRKGQVIGVGSLKLSTPALPPAAVWPWATGHTSLGPGEMGNEAPASSWGCCTDSGSPGKALTRGFQELRFPQRFASIRFRPECPPHTNAPDFLQNPWGWVL